MITERWRLPLAAVAFVLGLTSCGRPDGDSHGHPHVADGGHGQAAHAHDDERQTLVYTDYTEVTELFVEFPPLVAGGTSRFAAHVTRLDDAAPLTGGRLDVVLLSGDTAVARFRVRAPARAGIFTPDVTPRDAGEYRLLVEVEDADVRAIHDLGPVRVFASDAEVEISQSEPEGEISYLKEQQWTNPFASAEVRDRPMRASVPGFGTVQAPADAGAEMRAPSDGYFSNADLARAGDDVEAGAVLGYLVPRLGADTDFGQLVVALERARAALALARRDVERLEGLYEKGAVPERRLIEAREALDVAEAEYEAAEARAGQYQRGGARAGIAMRAPVAGEVVEVSVRPGAFVRGGDRVFRIASRERRWLEVEVPERYAGELRDASGAWLDGAEGESIVLDEQQGARVAQTSSAVDPVTRTAMVTIEYPAGMGPVIIGARYPAHVFTTPAAPRLAVPRGAVIDDGGRDVVYVQTGGETFARRPVELGIVDGNFVEVLEGVEAGERVASKGAYFVKLAATGGEEVGHGHAH